MYNCCVIISNTFFYHQTFYKEDKVQTFVIKKSKLLTVNSFVQIKSKFMLFFCLVISIDKLRVLNSKSGHKKIKVQ